MGNPRFVQGKKTGWIIVILLPAILDKSDPQMSLRHRLRRQRERHSGSSGVLWVSDGAVRYGSRWLSCWFIGSNFGFR
jgi:hypothetical protein